MRGEKVVNRATNAGVHAATGFEFQKHCALFIYLDRYFQDIDKIFFICFEHHDDFLFAYLNDLGELKDIEIYQAKKSTSQWGLNKKLIEPLSKILDTVDQVEKDEIQKEEDYKALLFFITNGYIKLTKNKITELINASNLKVPFLQLPEIIQEDIKKQILSLNKSAAISELDKLNFQYIDFPQNYEAQKDQLIGMFDRLFGEKVHDHKAAIDTLLSIFRSVELTFNQGNQSRLLDEKKRITSDELSDSMSIITEKTMAFKLWRKYASDIARSLEIPIKEHKAFELYLQSSFDFFKDKTQVQHQKIKDFVFSNKSVLENYYTDIEAIYDLAERYKKEHRGSLPAIQLRAAIFAAYIEMKGKE